MQTIATVQTPTTEAEIAGQDEATAHIIAKGLTQEGIHLPDTTEIIDQGMIKHKINQTNTEMTDRGNDHTQMVDHLKITGTGIEIDLTPTTDRTERIITPNIEIGRTPMKETDHIQMTEIDHTQMTEIGHIPTTETGLTTGPEVGHKIDEIHMITKTTRVTNTRIIVTLITNHNNNNQTTPNTLQSTRTYNVSNAKAMATWHQIAHHNDNQTAPLTPLITY